MEQHLNQDPSKITTFSIYAKNEWYLVKTILSKIKSGDWKLENNN